MFTRGKQTSKSWMLAVLAISLMLFVAACSGGNTAEPEADAPENEVQAPAPTDTPIPEATAVPDPTDTPVPEETDTEEFMTDMAASSPGHSIGFESSLEPGEAHQFLFLASPGDTVGGGVTSESELLIGVQNARTGEILDAVASNDDPLFVTIPENSLYHIVIEGAGGVGGDYVASFQGSPGVSFSLDPRYTLVVGRLPEGRLLHYMITAPGGTIVQVNVLPHPDTPIDLIVRMRDLESQDILLEVNEVGPGDDERFTFTVPDDGSGRVLTHIVTVEDVDGNAGAYIIATVSDADDVATSTAGSPESVVQAVFDAAKSGEFAALEDLCDPAGENDEDTQMICDIAIDESNREEFVRVFAAGKTGVAQISPDGTEAAVPFLFGPDGDSEEIMQLINRDGQWYLFSL